MGGYLLDPVEIASFLDWLHAPEPRRASARASHAREVTVQLAVPPGATLALAALLGEIAADLWFDGPDDRALTFTVPREIVTS